MSLDKLVAYLTYKKGDVEPGDHPANKNVEIRLMSSEGCEFNTLVKLFGGQGILNVNSWSSDNKKLAFVSYSLNRIERTNKQKQAKIFNLLKLLLEKCF